VAIDAKSSQNGNIATENTRTYIYDLSNQLIRVLDGTNLIVEYTYNGAGQRIKKVTQTETRIFHYDLLGHLIAETNQSGQMLAEYIYLGDQLLGMIKPGELVYYYHNDHLGTPKILTDDSQAIAWKGAYTPFGEAQISIENVENPFRFPGQYYDQETGLHYNWHRYYDPKTGRYLTSDPIGLEGGINLFLYVANNPVNKIDSKGLEVLGGISGWFGRALKRLLVLFEIGEGVLRGAEAYYKTMEGVARYDYAFYKETGDHIQEKFKDVNWEKYGSTFEEAWQNFLKERLEKKNKTCPVK
jgi:RHS repeat-associated protein